MIKPTAAALGYARQPPGFSSALVFSDVKPPTGQSAAYTQAAADDLSQMGLTVLTQKHLHWQGHWSSLGARHDGCRSAGQRRGWPLAPDGSEWPAAYGSVMQAAGNIGAITLKDGSVKAKVQLLPFDGDEYGVFAFVDPALLLNEAQCSVQ